MVIGQRYDHDPRHFAFVRQLGHNRAIEDWTPPHGAAGVLALLAGVLGAVLVVFLLGR